MTPKMFERPLWRLGRWTYWYSGWD